MFQFKLPDLGEGIHEAEILKWYVDLGEKVEEDASLVDLETDKATVTIPSPRAGTLVERAGEVGDTVEVGQVLAVIDDGSGAGEESASGPKEAPEASPEPQEQESAPAAGNPDQEAAESSPARGGHRRPVPTAPATRRLARELGLDIDGLTGSGPAGRVTPEDVRRAAAAGADAGDSASAESASAKSAGESTGGQASPEKASNASAALPDFSQFGPVEEEALRSIRRKTAHKMATAWEQIPHVSHFDEADVTALDAFRKRQQARLGDDAPKLTLLPFIAKAVVRALREFPQFNASIDTVAEKITYKHYYNLGLAVATERGLMVPVVRGADRLSVVELAEAIGDLAGRGREGTLTAEDFAGGTFTITNMGSIGGQAATPIINHPEVAILATMRAEGKPVVRDGKVVVRTMLPLVLAFDHRLIDGADAARFVNRIVDLLSDPETLLVES